jgi:hypothetical protein
MITTKLEYCPKLHSYNRGGNLVLNSTMLSSGVLNSIMLKPLLCLILQIVMYTSMNNATRDTLQFLQNTLQFFCVHRHIYRILKETLNEKGVA